MREITAKAGQELFIGKRGENNAVCVVFDISEWRALYGAGNVQLIHQRNGDKIPYPCVVEVSGGAALWTITKTDVGNPGVGRAELQYWVGDAIVKSEIFSTKTARSMGDAGENPPEPATTWLEQMQQLGAQTEENANAAEVSANDAAASAASARASQQAAASSASASAAFASVAAQSEVNAATSEKNAADSEAAAKAAQKAAEQARDETQAIAGGDFASTVYVDNKVAVAEENANKYTDDKVQEHNTSEDAHADIRAAVDNAVIATAQDISDKDLLDYLKLGKSGFYRGIRVANSPNTASWYYYEVIAGSTGFALVTARYLYGDTLYCGRYSGTSGFTGWTKLATEDYAATKDEVNAINTILATRVNPNLLDNWYFGNPVDQRGGYVVPPGTDYWWTADFSGATAGQTGGYRVVTELTATYARCINGDATFYCKPDAVVRGYTGKGYTIDRWNMPDTSLTLVLHDDCIEIIPSSDTAAACFQQRHSADEIPFGETSTLSFLTDAGLITTTFDLPERSTIKASTNFGLIEHDGYRYYFRCQVSGGDVSYGRSEFYRIAGTMNTRRLYAAKLDPGTQQTLAHQENGVWVLNEIPKKNRVLSDCQRTEYLLKSHNKNNWGVLATGWIESKTQARFLVNLPVTMRTTPALKLTGSMQITSKSGTSKVTSVAVQSFNGDSVVVLCNFAENTALVANEFAFLQVSNDATAFIEINSDM